MIRIRRAKPVRHARLAARLSLLAAGMTLVLSAASAQDAFDDGEAVRRWAKRLEVPRAVVDRTVICFDETRFFEEISRWDGERFWPVLLWDPALVPLFVEAFRPEQLLFARYAKKTNAGLAAGMRAVAAAWGNDPNGASIDPGGASIDAGGAPIDSARLLEALRERKRAPLGAVLVADGAPALAGGIALAAGRFQLPLPFAVKEKATARVPFETMESYRDAIAGRLDALGIAYDGKFDDLDFLTVANGMPFGYTQADPTRHGGGYTVDDALARKGEEQRWGWTGRLPGIHARAVYMVMGALFLQPEKGLFFSRYDPAGKGGFGAFDPLAALETFGFFFPCEAVRHPEATRARWRALQWPRGNRYGFVFVNSSGGATSWSTSKGGATHFDVPLSVPAVVHYTHSGSASRPFQVDTIAGRWMANGAYVYFGSYAEPYLGAFIPPKALAPRVERGVPLGAAMRHLYTERGRGALKKGEGDDAKTVSFNVTGPWKLAYFGDPAYRLTGVRPERIPATAPGKGYHASLRDFRRARPPGGAGRKGDGGDGHDGGQDGGRVTRRVAHLAASINTALVDDGRKKLVDTTLWNRIARNRLQGEEAACIQCAMVRVWTASLRRAGPGALYAERESRKLSRPPAALRRITAAGAASQEAGRLAGEFAKAYIAGIAAHPASDVAKKKELALWALRIACSFEHAPSEEGPFFAWIGEACAAIGVEPAALRAAVTETDWIGPGARKAAEKIK